MKLIIDTDARTLVEENRGERKCFDLYSTKAFERISHEWLRVGWNEKYTYTFAWMGRPIIQLPDDLIRTQEVLYRIKPDVIIETGVAHGGSLTFYASLCKAFGRGRVIGVDIEIRPHNRSAIEAHELAPMITLVEGDSVSPCVVAEVSSHIKPGETVLVLLDSCHTFDHVLKELEAYSPLVTVGSYIVATDGCMSYLTDVPRGNAEWGWNNPRTAAEEFVNNHEDFIQEQPEWPFNESKLCSNVTHRPGAWLRRLK